MKKLLGLLSIFFIVNTGHVLAQSVDSFVDVFDKLAKEKKIKIPSNINIETRSFEFSTIITIIKDGEKAPSFTMGSDDDEKTPKDEKPSHDVKLTIPFEMQKTEVTQYQYKLIMGNNPSSFKERGATYNRPVENVSYDMVQKFIKKLNELDSEYEYRLPTEAEWEYASDGGISTDKLRYYAWFADNSDERTHNVATRSPNNTFGLYDMFGNVQEWVSDFYGEKYYSSLDEFVDPQGPEEADEGSSHVIRGCSWNDPAKFCRASLRSEWSDENSVGFRLVRTKK
ncbi:MAG: formylglycine-generating enzyme family protein [Proteobacteria bacterium]|nr:formylglycine-generating enzyme family protein [Pseudomonadota bacterium]